MRSITEEMVTEIFKSENALGKCLGMPKLFSETPPFSDIRNGAAFLIRQMMDPENFRPPKIIENYRVMMYRHLYRDLSKEEGGDGEFLERPVPRRGAPKPGHFFTKKTSTTLMADDGVTALYAGGTDIVAIFDLRNCLTKEWPEQEKESGKYTFEKNAGTDGRGWIKGGSLFAPWTPIKKIRENNRRARQNDEVLRHNEVMACIGGKSKKEGLENLDTIAIRAIGLYCGKNDLEWRLNAQYHRLLLMVHLRIEVPIVFLSDNNKLPFHFYPKEDQEVDLARALKKTVDSNERDFALAIQSLRSELNVETQSCIPINCISSNLI